MSRRHAAEKREIIPDPKFGNVVVSKFMNAVMYAGKKSVAEGIVYGALEMIESKTKLAPLAARWRRHLSGAGGSAYVAPAGARHPLDHFGGARSQRKDDDRTALGRAA